MLFNPAPSPSKHSQLMLTDKQTHGAFKKSGAYSKSAEQDGGLTVGYHRWWKMNDEYEMICQENRPVWKELTHILQITNSAECITLRQHGLVTRGISIIIGSKV